MKQKKMTRNEKKRQAIEQGKSFKRNNSNYARKHDLQGKGKFNDNSPFISNK